MGQMSQKQEKVMSDNYNSRILDLKNIYGRQLIFIGGVTGKIIVVDRKK
jgi:hypothetical protein